MKDVTRRQMLAGTAGIAVAGAAPGLAREGTIVFTGAAPGAAALPVSQRAATTARLEKLPRPQVLPKPPGTVFFAPAPPAYPYARLDLVTRQVRQLSDALEAYIREWAAGRADAELPRNLVPGGTNLRDFPRFRLRRPEEVDGERQWAVRPSEVIGAQPGYRGFFPDPNCTYIVGILLAPFGSKLVMEGQFPDARFFDIQVTPSFEARTYRYDAAGVGEVPIVDVDIDPLPGHSNPFRGGRRDVAQRGWRVEYEMAIGDPTRANAAFRPPHFRGRGNRRVGGALFFRGPWGIGGVGGDGRGPFEPGQIWIRYYRPDRIEDSLAGVPLPRAWCELRTGERFWIEGELEPFVRRVNRRATPRATAPKPDLKTGEGPEQGWSKQAGIYRSIFEGIARGTNWAGKDYVRQLDKGVAGRGSDLPPPNNYEQSSTSATYIDYLVRGMSCERGHVVVLTGKLPTFPNLVGAAPLARAQMRYWSIVGYQVPEGLDFLGAFDQDAVQGVAMHAVRDDELTLDAERFYVIALSRADDRPANARAEAGVTWVDWGPAGKISWTQRWLSVGPEWKGSMIPTPEKIGRRGEWSESAFDPRTISTNGWQGELGPYLTRIGYMRTEEFEALGPRVSARDVPDWRV